MRLARVPLLGIRSLFPSHLTITQSFPNVSTKTVLLSFLQLLFSYDKSKAGWHCSYLFHFLPQNKSPRDTECVCGCMVSLPSQTLGKDSYYAPRYMVSRSMWTVTKNSASISSGGPWCLEVCYGTNDSSSEPHSGVSTSIPQSQK